MFTILLLTKNESSNISKWKNWIYKLTRVNEIVVVDDNSTDNTTALLHKLSTSKLSVKIFPSKHQGDLSSSRIYGLKKSTNDWILWLDADEQPDKKMIAFLNQTSLSNHQFSFHRQDIFLGKKLKYTETNYQKFIRLFNKKSGKFVGKVHEKWLSPTPTIQGNGSIIHRSVPTIYHFINKLNNYSTIRAKELYDSGTTGSLVNTIIYPAGKFIKNYFWHLGFLDGTPGIIFSLSMSFYSFLVRAKLWHLHQT